MKSGSKLKIILGYQFIIAFLIFFTFSKNYSLGNLDKGISILIHPELLPKKITTNKESISWNAVRMPEFIGGSEKLKTFLQTHIKYPQKALDVKIEGQVIVSIEIDVDVKVANPRIGHGVDPTLNAEALRVMSNLPSWNPGTIGGKLDKIVMYIPISFFVD